jgi:hypothetical protein
MIVPIQGLKYYEFEQPSIGDEISLVKEEFNPYDPMAIAVYNKLNQKIGHVARRKSYNQQVYNKMDGEYSITAIAYSVQQNRILVEIKQFRK